MNFDYKSFCAFDPVTKGTELVGMSRDLINSVAFQSGWSKESRREVIFGHQVDGGQLRTHSGRFAYLPLPSIQTQGRSIVVGAVRRLLVACFDHSCADKTTWLSKYIPGQQLASAHQPVGVLDRLDKNDWVLQQYIQPASTWTTVTPMILDGFLRRPKNGDYHENLAKQQIKIAGWVRKALTRVGFPELLTRHVEIETSVFGSLPGTHHVSQYKTSEHHASWYRAHVRLTFRDQYKSLVDVPGPIALGAGRFYGMGLFVKE